MGWVAKRWKTCFDFRANLISTKLSASHRKSTQVSARPGQKESQEDPSFQLVCTCDAVWPGLKTSEVKVIFNFRILICHMQTKNWDLHAQTKLFVLEISCNMQKAETWRHVQPWPNGVASRPKFASKTWVLGLVTSFGQALRALALTLAMTLVSLWSRSNLHASHSKFFTVWPPNPSQRKLSDVH